MLSQRVVLIALVLLLAGGFAFGTWWMLGQDSGRGIMVEVPPPPVGPMERPAHQPEPLSASGEEAAGDIDTSNHAAAADARNDADQSSQPSQPRVSEPAVASRAGPRQDHEGLRQEIERLREQAELERLQVDELAGVEVSVTIAGRVTDERLIGIAGAQVNVSHRAGRAPAEDGSELPNIHRWRAAGPAAATTGHDGTYGAVLTVRVPADAPSFELMVTAGAPGYASSGARVLKGIRPGDVHRGIDLELVKAGTVVGHVVGADMRPLQGVRISAIAVEEQPGAGRSMHRTTTGADGGFSLSNLAPGKWRVTAVGGSIYLPVTTDEFEVAQGQELRIPDIKVEAATSLRLRVLRDDGLPIGEGLENPRVRVALRFEFGDGRVQTLTTVALANGDVLFSRVPTDAATYFVSVPGFAAAGPYSAALTAGTQNNGGEVRLPRAR